MNDLRAGNKAEDSALLWFVDVRCSGANLPNEPEAAREWLMEKAAIFEAGLSHVANELSAGIDFAAPISRKFRNAAKGVRVEISCAAIRRLSARDIARALDEISSHWKEFLKQLELQEPLVR